MAYTAYLADPKFLPWGLLPMSSRQQEYEETEKPLLDQLQAMGWEWIEGDKSDPQKTGRTSFGQVLLEERLRAAIRRINIDINGEPWLDDDRIGQAVSTIERLPSRSVMEANQEVYRLLHEGTQDEPYAEKTGHSGEATVRYIDFENVENNDFLAINQFKVERPGLTTALYPDVVLFVNGIPMVVVECKASNAGSHPVEAAREQLWRYEGRKEDNAGIPKLFFYNQLMVATSFEEAQAGAIGAPKRFFQAWKEVWPKTDEEVLDEVSAPALVPQHRLVAGMLRPANFVDLVRNFILFDDGGEQTSKIVARYQQFRAVQRTIGRLQNGQVADHGDGLDRRGGIVWHTQGSGKSFTMVFLVKKMRKLPVLRRFKVVIVTDRKALQKQLSKTAKLTGQPVRVARGISDLKALLRKKGEGLVFAMIQKYQERGEPGDDEAFPCLNDAGEILVMVDEAHRSQSQKLHANLLRALPNCARIGFTGTPILDADKKRTHEIFGPYIDTYTIDQSVADGATLQIYYEGRYVEWDTRSEETLDMHFDAAFSNLSATERDEIRKRYVTRQMVAGAEKLIRAKARDMLWHYIEVVLPNGFKAQVVAKGRDAAVRYQKFLEQARGEILEELELADPSLARLEGDEIKTLPEETQRLARALRHRELIEGLEFAAVISAGKGGAEGDTDPDSWKKWTRSSAVVNHVARFKKPLIDDDPNQCDGLAFLCIDSMLLTGFDAPIEQVMYIDRSLRQHNLLQAIARTNRIYEGKSHGLIVDYRGLAEELNEALDVYSNDDIEGAWVSVDDELPRLADRHHRVVSLFRSEGLELDDTEDCVYLLDDVELRAEFLVRYKEFLHSLDVVMPRPQALDYERDATKLSRINSKAAIRYRDEEQLNLSGAPKKVRELLDEYVRAQGIDPRVEPVSIMDADFERHVEREVSPRAKASEMEHAMRHHIDVHFDEDPVRYQGVSERLEEIRAELEGDWERMLEKLRELKVRQLEGEPDDPDGTGLDGRRELPFYRKLKEQMEAGEAFQDRSREYIEVLAEETRSLVVLITDEIDRVDFWDSAHYQEQLRKKIMRKLARSQFGIDGDLEKLGDDLVTMAKRNKGRLVKPD